MGFAERMTKEIKKYDKDLILLRDDHGRLSLWREVNQVEYFDLDGISFGYSYPKKQLVFHMTNNFSASGKPVEWGLVPVLNRLRAMDLKSRPEWFEEFMNLEEKEAKSKERDFENTVESFMYEFRDSVKKTFSDTNTSLMNKRIKGV